RREQLRKHRLGQRPDRRVERLHPAVLANERRTADTEMQIRGAGGGHGVKQLVDERRGTHGAGDSEISTMWAVLTRTVAERASTYRNTSGSRAQSLTRSCPSG